MGRLTGRRAGHKIRRMTARGARRWRPWLSAFVVSIACFAGSLGLLAAVLLDAVTGTETAITADPTPTPGHRLTYRGTIPAGLDTAGFEPAGGGFAQYVRVMDWIVRDGVEVIPEGVSFEAASFVEPVNTCVKAVDQVKPRPGDVVLVQGQGPIGLIFTLLLKRLGCVVVASDMMPERRGLSTRLGAAEAHDPREVDIPCRMKELTSGRGADLVIGAVSAKGVVDEAVRATRPGGTILLFAQTSETERIDLSGADICKHERTLAGCYSASIDLQAESARLVFSGELPV
ncbi:MAG: zinc-binding dehydrogenase, partial [Dehalococcoidia bacterium]|nr:zinc-binding dehydrogenase [Dehalococcoidia bacterium]